MFTFFIIVEAFGQWAMGSVRVSQCVVGTVVKMTDSIVHEFVFMVASST